MGGPNKANLAALPPELLAIILSHASDIEDFMNLTSTCRSTRAAAATARPSTILRLAAAQSRIFFRPSPHFLVAAVAQQLGDWARQSDANEAELVSAAQQGIDGLLELALELKSCGLTMERIRELHLMRFSVINPVEDIIDKCVGAQWYSTPGFWNGGVSDAYTISANPAETLFHLAIYGDLFGPDLEAYLNSDSRRRTLRVETRLEFVKYCIPDFATTCFESYGQEADPRRVVLPTGPYTPSQNRTRRPEANFRETHNLALTWTLGSSRWRPHWKAARTRAAEDFDPDFQEDWWYEEDDGKDWRQRLWETVVVCQGLEGLKLISPKYPQADCEHLFERMKIWRSKIEAMQAPDRPVMIGRQATHSWPFLSGDLRVCASGYVAGS